MMLLLFHRIFGDEKDNDGSRGDSSTVEWQQQAMLCLVRLTNMALGGFVQDFAPPAIQEALLKTTRKGRIVSSIGAPRTTESISTSFYQQKNLSTQVSPPQFLSFALPSSKKAASSPSVESSSPSTSIPSPLNKTSRQVNPKANVPSIPSQTSLASQSSSKDSDSGTAQMTIVCVRFGRPSDIELFWIESCKTFADLANSTNPSISHCAIYCLEVRMHCFITIIGYSYHLPLPYILNRQFCCLDPPAAWIKTCS